MVRYVVELARQLAAHPEVDLSVLTTPATHPLFAELVGGGDRVLTLPALPTPARSLLERPGWGVPAFRRPFDVIHGTKHLLPRGGGRLRVLTVHDLLPMDRPGDFPWLKRRLLVGPYRASLRAADLLLCVSEATRDRLLAEQPDALARSVVVPLAMSSSLRDAPPREVPALSGRRFALVVGDASPRKNLMRVLESWEQVVLRDPEAVLAIAGPQGWGVDQRGRRFDRLTREGAVLPLGHVDDCALHWLYVNARVVACPSLLEGFGLPAIEALHFGTPLITSTDPALVEASHGAALHVPADDTGAWTEVLARAVALPRPPHVAHTSRTWEQVAEETVRAVHVHAGRGGRR